MYLHYLFSHHKRNKDISDEVKGGPFKQK